VLSVQGIGSAAHRLPGMARPSIVPARQDVWRTGDGRSMGMSCESPGAWQALAPGTTSVPIQRAPSETLQPAEAGGG
jgi:hypothetical protein